MPSPNEFNDYTFLKRFTSNPTEPLWMMSIILQTINCAIAWNSCICSSWCRLRHQKVCRNRRLLRNVTFPFTFFAVLFTNGHRLHRNEGHRTVREIPAKRSHFISIRLGIFSVSLILVAEFPSYQDFHSASFLRSLLFSRCMI